MSIRKFAFLLPLALVVLSCNNAEKDTHSTNENNDSDVVDVDQPINKKDTTKNITKRDYSITKENAYSDLFLDSMAMERYIDKRGLGDKKIAPRMRSFYNARNYQYAWMNSSGLTEQTRFFWNQYDYAVTHLNDSSLATTDFYKKADKYVNQEKLSVGTGDSSLLNLELGLTEHFIRYINSTYEKGYVKRKEQEKFIPVKRSDPLVLADSLISKKHKDDRYYEDVNEMYGALKKELEHYYSIVKGGGWPLIPSFKGSLKKGSSNDVIPVIKKRLQVSGDMPVADTTKIFTDTLEAAVMQFQRRHGHKEDGIINAALVKDMNVPADARLQQILINMDRMRWMPQKPQGNLVIVNIPEFRLYVYEGKKKLFDMAVVVGKVGNNTMMFNGELSQVIFSPYWNVPPSIVEKEIMPAVARNPNYLANKNMEEVDGRIRQRPGPGNALGKVKFIFPNNFNMYFHDTPSKSLFNEDKRAFSHGCIRLAEPQKMAEWLLRNDPNWPSDKIVDAMNAGKERAVKLKDKVPVFIIYYTSWVDDTGLLHFREDVYKHDAELARKMFTVPSALNNTVMRVDNAQIITTN
jgi:L,D-transpeptidase YcbB